MIAKPVGFGCLTVFISVSAWTIGRAAEEPGQHVYEANCKRCHGPEGRGTDKGPNLIPFKWSYEKTLQQIRYPQCDMPSFTMSELSDEEVGQIVAYLKTIK